jgi:hypothetical protein
MKIAPESMTKGLILYKRSILPVHTVHFYLTADNQRSHQDDFQGINLKMGGGKTILGMSGGDYS